MSGTMVSPWPPSTIAVTSSGLTSNSSARKKRNLAASRIPAMPTTLLRGSPLVFCSAQTMASSGLVTQMTKASGAYLRKPAPTCSMTLRLISRRSSRLMPGLRGTPAVTITTSASLISAYSLAPLIFGLYFSIGAACDRSSALPCGTPSTTSNSTTSPRSLRPARWASVPPIWPAPISAIRLRAMVPSPQCDAVTKRGHAPLPALVTGNSPPLQAGGAPPLAGLAGGGAASTPQGEIGLGAHLHHPRGGAGKALGADAVDVKRMRLGRGRGDQPHAIVIKHIDQGNEAACLIALLWSEHRNRLDHQRMKTVRDALIVEGPKWRCAEIGKTEARHAKRRLRHGNAAALVAERLLLAAYTASEPAEGCVHGGLGARAGRHEIKVAAM